MKETAVNKPKEHNGAGAACLFDPSGNLIDSSVRRAGTHACSYSAESRGAEAGLEDLILNKHFDTIVRIGSLLWVIDSKGFASALQKGCLRQTSFAEARAWHFLLRLAERGVRIAIAWVFSHTETDSTEDGALTNSATPTADAPLSVDHLFSPRTVAVLNTNKTVDALVDSAVTDLEATPCPTWYVDAARAGYRQIKQDKLTLPPGLALPGVPRSLIPIKLQRYKQSDPNLVKIRGCLRSGVWKPLGIANNVRPSCTVCGTANALGRHHGVVHMFACPDKRAVDLRSSLNLSDTPHADLWNETLSVRKHDSIAKYAIEFKRLLATTAALVAAPPAAPATSTVTAAPPATAAPQAATPPSAVMAPASPLAVPPANRFVRSRHADPHRQGQHVDPSSTSVAPATLVPKMPAPPTGKKAPHARRLFPPPPSNGAGPL